LTCARLGQRFAVTALDCFGHYGRGVAQGKPRKADDNQDTKADEQITARLGHAESGLASFCKEISFGQGRL
jgi:hypothetical protein